VIVAKSFDYIRKNHAEPELLSPGHKKSCSTLFNTLLQGSHKSSPAKEKK
jgi:hypothetical protein